MPSSDAGLLPRQHLESHIKPAGNPPDSVNPGNALAYDNNFGFGLRAIAQKNFCDERLTAVYNLALEYQTVRFEGLSGRTDELEWDNLLGLAWKLTPQWHAGVEWRNHNAYADFERHTHTVIWFGPTLAYRNERFWVLLSWLEQLYGTPNGYENGVFLGNDKFLVEHERREITIRLGVPT